jgi:TetR/AcrR family acrAB operon transcriptional repressor
MRRTKADAAITRESLLKAGLVVFSRQGYTATTLVDVAKEAGVTRGAIYWHFGSKADLYSALLAQYAAMSSQVVQSAAAEGGELTEVLKRVFTRLLQAVATNAELRAVMEISLFKTERSPELTAIQAQQRSNANALIESFTAVMRQGIAIGALRGDLDPAELARAFLAANNGAISLWLSDPQAFSLENSAPALAEIFMSGILTR